MTPLIALLWATVAHAQTVGIDRTHPDVDVVQDLESGRAGDRLVAARSLKQRVNATARRAAHARDPFDRREAEIDLHDACTDPVTAIRRSLVAFANVRRPLARVVVTCGDVGSLPALRDARAAETRAGVQRRLDEAIVALEAR